jgi:catechol 2,3-dioxygenase-like lactoylglutathione lyase family enzyme
MKSREPTSAAVPAKPRIHVAFAVRDLDRSIAFYRILFGRDPSKRKPGYAKFENAEPGLNLALNEVAGYARDAHSVEHFGIELGSPDAVTEATARLRAAGLETRVEDEVTCCYAVQKKVWVADPDGRPWEVYVVLDSDAASYRSSASDCCAELRKGSSSSAVEETETGHPAGSTSAASANGECCGVGLDVARTCCSAG